MSQFVLIHQDFGYDNIQIENITICNDMLASDNLNSIYITYMDNEEVQCNCVEITSLTDGQCVSFSADSSTFCHNNRLLTVIVNFNNRVFDCQQYALYDYSSHWDFFDEQLIGTETFYETVYARDDDIRYSNENNYANFELQVTTVKNTPIEDEHFYWYFQPSYFDSTWYQQEPFDFWYSSWFTSFTTFSSFFSSEYSSGDDCTCVLNPSPLPGQTVANGGFLATLEGFFSGRWL